MLINQSDQRPRVETVHKQDFNNLLDEVIRVARQQKNLAEAAKIVLTLDGRIAAVDAYNTLAPKDILLLNRYGECEISTGIFSDQNGGSSALVFAISETGRPIFARAADLSEEYHQIGQLMFDGGDLVSDNDLEVPLAHHLIAAADGILPQSVGPEMLAVLDIVEFAIDHIDPVVLYVKDTMFTNFDSFNNLLGRPAIKKPGYVLTDLRSRDLKDWSDDEKTLIASVYLLAKAGVRVEELNGQQVNLSIVEALLREKYASLCRLTGSVEQQLELIELPVVIAALRKAIRPQLFAYRTVNGLTFNKKEHYLARTAVDLSVAAVPAALSSRIEAEFGCRLGNFSTIDEYFGALTVRAFEAARDWSEPLTRYERLFELIVDSAIAETAASIGMTRGLRDMRSWSRLCAQRQYTALCEMPPTDYYCAVFTSEDARQALRAEGRYAKVLTAIAQRMTFNSWHYTPGHVPFDQVPRDRHFYVPPKMSDLAIWSDRHHQGHILANVRYSIRSPGGLMVNGHKQHGLFDIRLMRSAGDPFTLSDLLCARRHTAYMRAVLQTSLDRRNDDPSEQIIRAFTKEYYKHV